jgi:hydrogenase large subunit
MAVTFNIDPVTRIEGHLKVHITVNDGGAGDIGTFAAGHVSYVECQSKLFRGFENILTRRDPRDAPVICQRI